MPEHLQQLVFHIAEIELIRFSLDRGDAPVNRPLFCAAVGRHDQAVLVHLDDDILDLSRLGDLRCRKLTRLASSFSPAARHPSTLGRRSGKWRSASPSRPGRRRSSCGRL